jgi:archaemetzincin
VSVASDTSPLAEVVPLGRVPPVACAVVAANLQAVLGLPTQVVAARLIPAQAHLRARDQYDAAPILSDLRGDLESARARARARARVRVQVRVGVTALDLCLPILTFVYGEALVGGGVAVVSLARLGALPGAHGAAGSAARSAAGSAAPPEKPGRLYERIAKVALHETAHAMGLTHCRKDGCLMAFSVGLEKLDGLYLAFCPACEHRLAGLRNG